MAKMKKSLLFIAIAIILISLVVAVKGFPVDISVYRLEILHPEYHEDFITFDIVNPQGNEFVFSDLHSYNFVIDGKKYSGKFSNELIDQLALVGTFPEGRVHTITLPYDTRAKSDTCNQPIKLELVSEKGQVVSRYVGIPKCVMPDVVSYGLEQIDYCTAEFFDGITRIIWKLVDVDFDTNKVKIQKIQNNQVKETWHKISICPDVVSGSCATEISNINFNDGVYVTLKDNRLGTSVTLSNSEDNDYSCFKISEEIENIKTIKKVEESVLQPTKLVDANKNNLLETCDSCQADGNCYNPEERIDFLGKDVYCKNSNWKIQKDLGKTCSADYECKSNICYDRTCVDEEPKNQNFITRFLLWIDNLI